MLYCRPVRNLLKIAGILSLLVCGFDSNAEGHDTSRSNAHLQTTSITQMHPGFNAKYSGANSLTTDADMQTSLTVTAFAGFRLWNIGELYINPELAGGSGFSRTRGVAAFPNGEIYRVDDAAPKWTLSRMFFKKTLGFSGETEEIKDDLNQLSGVQSVERLTAVVGRFALNDYFDRNTYSHDPRTQFLNWALMDNAAWDYAADTRGYSWGFFLEYNASVWSLRFASVMVPKQANQLELETNFPQYRGDNLEIDYRFKNADQPGAVRILVFDNHANMGDYRASINGAGAGGPDVTLFRSLTEKYGAALNIEQALTSNAGVFGRASWNNGRTESWAFTEADQALSFGGGVKGEAWSSPGDSSGVALMFNGLSAEHRDYLAIGGSGFMLGDGKLNYAPEELLELYYLRHVIQGLDLTGDYQFIQNPGYNSDRGPVSVFSIRVHSQI